MFCLCVFGKFVCRQICGRKICFGKFGAGKSVSENSVSGNLLSEKSPRLKSYIKDSSDHLLDSVKMY